MTEQVRGLMTFGPISTTWDIGYPRRDSFLRDPDTDELLLANDDGVLYGIIGSDPSTGDAQATAVTWVPVAVQPDVEAARTADLMREYALPNLAVADDEGGLVGTVRLQDLRPDRQRRRWHRLTERLMVWSAIAVFAAVLRIELTFHQA